MQSDTCFADRKSQRLPHRFGMMSMFRCRYRWPPQGGQSPQELQGPHTQSWHLCAAQCWMLHPTVSRRALEQALPPPMEGCLTSRTRERCPPPQLTEHWDHSCHSNSSQFTCFTLEQSAGVTSSGPGLQGSISFRLSLKHVSPFPDGNFSMYLDLVRIPKQWQLHFVQAVQEESAQSTSAVQGSK